MIAYLKGVVAAKGLDNVIIELGGIGYEVIVPAADYGAIATGKEATLYIHEQIREDAYNLYGFANLASKRFFEQLLTISGIGPKVAMGVLSAAPLAQLQSAVAAGDPELLRGVAGIGKKTAERIVVELKGKVEALDLTTGAAVTSAGDPAYQALIGLGYSAGQAAEALASIPTSATTEQERVKAALKQLSS